MGRLAGILVAGGVLAMGCADRAFAVAPDPSQAKQVFAGQPETVTARVHLVYKPDAATPLDGAVTIIEQQQALAVAGGYVIISTAATHASAAGQPAPSVESSARSHSDLAEAARDARLRDRGSTWR
jgi:hypothetical protein